MGTIFWNLSMEQTFEFFEPEYWANMGPFSKSTGLTSTHPGDPTWKPNWDSQYNLNHISTISTWVQGDKPAWKWVQSDNSTWVTSPTCWSRATKARLPENPDHQPRQTLHPPWLKVTLLHQTRLCVLLKEFNLANPEKKCFPERSGFSGDELAREEARSLFLSPMIYCSRGQRSSLICSPHDGSPMKFHVISKQYNLSL